MEIKGELKLCQEGQRLFDEYIRELELAEKKHTLIHVFASEELWDAYQLHREECDECKYV